MDFFSSNIPVPEVFWSFETGAPFCKCALCNCDLVEEARSYIVEKAFAKGEVLFEHAICLNCRDDLYNELSVDSRRRIEHYLDEHVDMEDRQLRLIAESGSEVEGWTNRCLVKGTKVDDLDEYQIYGFCIGKKLVFNGAPYVLSGAVIEDVLKLLSPETRGVIDDYSERLFGLDMPQGLVVL